jgi:type IV pilus assembly protein PilZ
VSGQERRRSARHEVRIRIDYRAGEGDFLIENTRNISHGGMFIETRTPPDVGTILSLRFRAPDTDEVVEVQGRVVWVNVNKLEAETPNPGMGLEFIKLTPEEKDTISRIVGAIAYL